MSETGVCPFALRELLAVERLPALPQTAIRLLKLARDPSNGPAEFAVHIEADPGLAGQVLRFVNSSYFSFRCPISSVKQAVSLVGIRTIQNFVLWHAIYKMIPNPRCSLFDLKALWRDSLRRALYARALSRALGVPDTEEVFTASLLQDMAIPLLAKAEPEAYSRFFYTRNATRHRVRLSQFETQTFGWTHALAAAFLARKWNLPETLASLIQNHVVLERPSAPSTDGLGKLAVALSAILPAEDDKIWSELSQLEDAYAQVRRPEGPSTEDLLREADEEFADMAPLLQVSAPRLSLVEAYRKAVAERKCPGVAAPAGAS